MSQIARNEQNPKTKSFFTYLGVIFITALFTFAATSMLFITNPNYLASISNIGKRQ